MCRGVTSFVAAASGGSSRAKTQGVLSVTKLFVVSITRDNKQKRSLNTISSQPCSKLITIGFHRRSTSSTRILSVQVHNHPVKPIPFMSSAARRMQPRSTLRLQTPRRRQRSRSPDPTTLRSSTLPTDLTGGQFPSPTPLQNTFVKRSKKRENQNPANASSSHNHSRGYQNDTDTGPVARGDKSKPHKPPSSKNRHTVNQSTETLSSTRTVIPGRRDRDRSLTRGESGRSSKRTPSLEPTEVDEDPQLTGPIAVAQYTRLQTEVEKLREVRSKHVMIDTTQFQFTHAYSNYSGRRRQLKSKARSSMS